MAYHTTQWLDGITSLSGLTVEEKAAALKDAESVYSYLRQSEGQRKGAVPDDALRTWAGENDLNPDTINKSIALLIETRRIVQVAE